IMLPMRFAPTSRHSVALVAVAAALCAAPPARADGSGSLPKGYTTDQLPQLPSSSASSSAATQTQAPAAPSAAPAHPQAQTSVQASAQTTEYVDTDPSATTEFREPLAPYGVWVEDPNYGLVWVPSSAAVGADFAPYVSAGYWSMTDDGDWYWVSDYEWGY